MRLAPLACLLCLTLSCLPAAKAEAQGVRWQVQCGCDNVYKEDSWVPVFVELINDGDSQSGYIVIPVARLGYVTQTTPKLKYAIAVDLPAGARKRYTLYVPAHDLEKVHLNLSDLREKKEISSVTQVGLEDYLTVVVGGQPGLLRFLSGAASLLYCSDCGGILFHAGMGIPLYDCAQCGKEWLIVDNCAMGVTEGCLADAIGDDA